MGLLMAAGASISSVLGDQWLEYFYCNSMDNDVLVQKGEHHHGKSGLLNRGGSDNVITNGSTIVVNEGQCMIIVEQGAIVDICAEPGAYTFDTSAEPSIFSGSLGEGIKQSFDKFKKRFAHGGVTNNDQRVYYFNTKDIIGNKYGTASPVPFRVVDQRANLDIDISIKCFGEFSYRLSDPILFYKNICGNVEREYTRDQIQNQLRSELLTALQPAFAKISDMGIRYSSLPGHADDLAKALNDVLSESWGKTYGIQISTFGVSSVKADEEDEKMIKEMQKTASFTNANMAAAYMVNSTGQAMQDAAKNTGGAFMGFAGMNAAQNAGGVNAQQLFAMGQQQQAQAAQSAPAPEAQQGWACECGHTGNTGKFCAECGKPKPAPKMAATTWKCASCGTEGNTGKFCMECGTPKPADNGPWTCPSCGHEGNTGKFCGECGKPRA